MKININEPKEQRGITLLQLAFRPFFLGAAMFSVMAIVLWMGIYTFGWEMRLLGIPSTLWHAHEMLFGYLLAVIAGFLLTAVKNWTGQQTLHGPMLLLLLMTWTAARLVSVFNIGSVEIMALLDCLFLAGLTIAAAAPIIRVKQWTHLGILGLLTLMLIANIVFYAGIMGLIENGANVGIYSGFYLILMLVFVMARRVIPFFIERGAGMTTQLKNINCVDKISPVLFGLLWIVDVLVPLPLAVAVLAGALFFLHSIRLVGWYTHGLWQSSMLWILFLAYSFLVIGFALKSASIIFGISPFLSVHAFTMGGVGVLTLGMMARVSLGHTGRNVLEPPAALSVAFVVLLASAVVRVIFPLIVPSEYVLWVTLSQVGWILSFSLFLILFFPILTAPRIDGQPG